MASVFRLFKRGMNYFRREGLSGVYKKISEYLSTYQEYIQKNEPSEAELTKQTSISASLPYQPLISLITPVYRTPEGILRSTLDSVLVQTYPHWQLCIANGSPESTVIGAILNEYQARDSRIQVITMKQNLGIAVNTNSAISLAGGEFVGFLDHDDLLAPCALYEIAKALSEYSESDVLYSDEDILSGDGKKRYNPYFKPAFSPDYLRFANYMCHFLVVRKKLGDELGWIRTGFEGAQDYDFVLRCVENAKMITHIPKMLYHWRVLPTSTATNTNNKMYAIEAGMKALSEHLKRTGLGGTVETGPLPTTYIVKGHPSQRPLVSIIIPNQNHESDLRRCIGSILDKTGYKNYEIIIVENNSSDSTIFEYYRILESNSGVHVIQYNDKPFNYSKINNLAASSARGEILLFLNNDIEIISPDWLERMVEHAVRKDVGAVGAKLYYPNRTVQHAGVILGSGGVAGHSHKDYPQTSLGYHGRLAAIQNLSAVTAACLMIRKDVFYEVDGFDPEYELAFGDVDMCMKLRKKGFLIVWTPLAELIHYESKTRGHEDTKVKKARFTREIRMFQSRWSKELAVGDPYYNPHLSLAREDFSRALYPSNQHPRALPGIEPNND